MLGRLRMQAHKAREAYKRIAKQVFLNKRDFFLSLDPHATTPNVDGVALEQEIKAVVKQEIGHEDERLFDGRDNLGDVYAPFPLPREKIKTKKKNKKKEKLTPHPAS